MKSCNSLQCHRNEFMVYIKLGVRTYFSLCRIGFVSTGCVGYKMVPLSWFAMRNKRAENELAQIQNQHKKSTCTYLMCVYECVSSSKWTIYVCMIRKMPSVLFSMAILKILGFQSEAMRDPIHQGKPWINFYSNIYLHWDAIAWLELLFKMKMNGLVVSMGIEIWIN